MKKIFGIILMSIMSISFMAWSQSAYYKRITNSAECIAQQGPYSFISNINVASANWTRPDSIIILGICIEDSGYVRISCAGSDSVKIYSPDFQCYPINVTKIYKLGTDSLIRNGYITVFGYKLK